MTTLGPITQNLADREFLDTEVFVVAAPAPVFVDSSGRRRKALRRFAYAFAGVCALYGGLVCVSLAGGPDGSRGILPFPALAEHADQPSPIPGPRQGVPAPKARLLETAQRRNPPIGRQDRLLSPAAVQLPRSTTKAPAAALESTRQPTPTPTSTGSPVDDEPTETPSPTGPASPAATP